ncbi:hypothetical protein PBY51_003093 [Eleginops maclovinus]|uniref:Uncharacterized protein n=2 Tax=Eleginops maclovinus TaxID=56733 RepID=A0AAN7XF00_ELEMC|nr:hypothetical protein PBY51_003093 [Eleginops maclovinus]
MKGLLLLLCYVELLGSLLCHAGTIGTSNNVIQTPPNLAATTQNSKSDPESTLSTTSRSDLKGVAITHSDSLATASLDYSSHSSSISSGKHQPTTICTTTTSPAFIIYRKECLPLLIVSGGLIIACTILLVSTLLLIWKVCQLSRCIKMLSSNTDLISTSEYRMGTAKRNKNASELEAKENTVLMSDIGQTQEDLVNGTTKEDSENVKEDGQKEEKKKEEIAKSEEASADTVTIVENASKPQEEATDSKSTEAAPTSNCKGTEEPKDDV